MGEGPETDQPSRPWKRTSACGLAVSPGAKASTCGPGGEEVARSETRRRLAMWSVGPAPLGGLLGPSEAARRLEGPPAANPTSTEAPSEEAPGLPSCTTEAPSLPRTSRGRTRAPRCRPRPSPSFLSRSFDGAGIAHGRSQRVRSPIASNYSRVVLPPRHGRTQALSPPIPPDRPERRPDTILVERA
jgi:hypothetical protein